MRHIQKIRHIYITRHGEFQWNVEGKKNCEVKEYIWE